MRAESLNNSIFSFKIDDNNISEKQITNYNDINEILSQNKDNKMKILYLNKTNIHKILYDAEETIKITSEMMNNDLSNFFYLILLIEDNPNIINYEYPLDLIRKINNKIKNGDSSIFIKILKYKIIIELIKNYKGTDNYEKEQNEELEKIEKDNRNSIEFFFYYFIFIFFYFFFFLLQQSPLKEAPLAKATNNKQGKISIDESQRQQVKLLIFFFNSSFYILLTKWTN